jgi:hypothetical protein
MVILSFGAIQFQTQIEDDALRDSHVSNNGSTLKVTVAEIELNRAHYKEDLNLLTELLNRVKSLGNVASESSSNPADRIGELTKTLYLRFFAHEPVPPDVAQAITTKCADPSLDKTTQQQCSSFKEALNDTTTSWNRAQLDIENSRIAAVHDRINKYEHSSMYSEAADIQGYQRMAQFIFPWIPEDILLPALPHPILVMIVTLSMGALGSALFMLQLHLARQGDPSFMMSISWHLFRPLQGMATALAIFLLVKAGQISVSHTSAVGDTDLNAFVLGFLGVISGLLSDRAMDRLTAAGVDVLRTSEPPQRNNTPPTDQTVDPPKPPLATTGIQQADLHQPHDDIPPTDQTVDPKTTIGNHRPTNSGLTSTGRS